MAFLVSSNWRLDLTTGSTCFERSSSLINVVSNKCNFDSNSSQRSANVVNVSRRFSKLFNKSLHSRFNSVFLLSIT